MTTSLSKALLAVAATALLVSASPVVAATSAVTDAFVAGVNTVALGLRSADNLALQRGTPLHAFARRDLAAQGEAMAALAGWVRDDERADRAASQARTIDGLGPFLYPFDSRVLPLFVHGRAETEPYGVVLARLSTLDGEAFTGLYRDQQRLLLIRLVEIYADYIKNGDDPALRLISVRNLPQTKRLLAALR